jgi:5-formyltetrahydrofolate cyclo-ligase
MTRGPIRSARVLSLAGAVAPDTRCPPTLVGTTRDHDPDGLRGTLFMAPSDSPSSSWPEGAGRATQMLDVKKDLRSRAVAVRKSAFETHGTEASRMLAAYGLDFIKVRPGMIVSGFAAIRDEINPADLMLWLHAEGVRLALPVMVGKGKPLVMRAWSPGDAMEAAAWGIAEPTDDKPEVEPDVVLVPLLAFDARGYRLGYGGGFYDRTLAKLRATRPVIAVGLAYDEQKVDAVPFESYDQRLDWVLTPSGPKVCEA